jgi:hypothetical protein
MTPEEMMLNLACLDKGIVQLNDIASVQKQFDALNPPERRKVSRKIRKLAKKFIRKSSVGFERTARYKMSAAGFCSTADRNRKLRERYNRVKVLYVRRLLMNLITKEKDLGQQRR